MTMNLCWTCGMVDATSVEIVTDPQDELESACKELADAKSETETELNTTHDTDLSGIRIPRDEDIEQLALWNEYQELRRSSSSTAPALAERLKKRLPETALAPAVQKQMELFLDPYWMTYLDQFPENFPLEEPETFAPVVLDNLVAQAGFIKETERRTLVDLVRRKMLPHFRCTLDDVTEQVHEVLANVEESKTLGLEALMGAGSMVQAQYSSFNYAPNTIEAQSAFVRQPGYRGERVKLTGDLHNLGQRQREVLLMLQFDGVNNLHLKQVATAFGGGMVFFVTPYSESEKLPSSVVKLGSVLEVREEVEKTAEFASFFGLTTPRIKNYVTLPEYSSHEIAAAMELELCGGVFGLPAFANAPAVVTLEKIVSHRFVTTAIRGCNREPEFVPPALSRDFSMLRKSDFRCNTPTDIVHNTSSVSFTMDCEGRAGSRYRTPNNRTNSGTSPTDEASVSSKQFRYCKRNFTFPGAGSPVRSEADKKDDTSHIDLQVVLVEVLERNLWGFVFNTPNDGPSVRKVQPVDLVATYKIQHLIHKAVVNRGQLKIATDGSEPRTPIDFEECDPEGKMRKALVGDKYCHLSFKEFFTKVGEACERFRSVPVVTGRCHGDLHGGNLLIDSHGMAWLIDFATAKPGGVHVLYDLTKLLMTSLIKYPQTCDVLGEETAAMGSLFQVMAALPSNRHIIPEAAYRFLESQRLQFTWELAARLRNAAAKYEADDDLDSPYPWVIAMLSWCLRISTYREPEMPHLRLCLFGALCMGTRILYMDDEASAPSWITQLRQMYVSSKISVSHSLNSVGIGEDFKRELRRYLVSVATKDSWLTDPITRQQTQVMDMQVSCTNYDSKLQQSLRKPMRHASSGQRATETLNLVLRLCLSSSSTVEARSGRLLVISESGMGKTLFTKQLTSQVAQMQLLADYERMKDEVIDANTARLHRLSRRMVPIRVPLIDFPKLYRENPGCIECDPNTDFLALWAEWKFGKTGSAARLIKMHRQASIISQQKNQQIIRDDDDIGYSASECFLMCVFDGLDECADHWQECLQFIRNFIEAEPRHICVLTARPGEDSAINQLQENHNFSAFRIMPLSQEQSEQFCRRKLQMLSTPESIMERIIRIVCYSSEYKEMRTIPLILSLLLNYHRASMTNQKNTPLSKTNVYRHAAHLMLYQVGANKVAARDVFQHETLIQLNKCRMLLRHGAWIAHRDRALTFGLSAHHRGAVQRDAYSRTAPVFWAELRVVAELKGLLDPLERLITATANGHIPLLCGDQVKFRFSRLAYEELLCGEFIACVLTQDQSLTPRLFLDNLELLQDEAWHEPILHCLSSLSDSTMVHWLHTYILDGRRPRRSFCCNRRRDPVSLQNSNAELLLKIAAQFGSKVVVETLLQADVSPLCRYKDGKTPLHLAAKLGHTAVVETLLEFNACARGTAALNDNLRTPLQEAILKRNVDVFRALTRNSTSRGFPTDKALRDYPALKITATNSVMSYSRNPTIDDVKMDLEQNEGKLSPLMLSAYEGACQVVESMLKQLSEPSINARCPGSARASALCFAAENGRPKVVKVLLEAGLDYRIRYGPKNCSLLFWPCFAGYYEVVRLLLEANAHPNGIDSADEDGRHCVNELSPLHAAAATGQVVVVELLLGFGADPLICYKPLMLRPIHLAAFFGSDEIYNLLISRGDTGKADHGSPVGPEDLRHLYECPPGSIPKNLQKLSKQMERLF